MSSAYKGTGDSTTGLLFLFAWTGAALPVLADGADRNLPANYEPGVSFTVSIVVDAPDGAVAMGLEDSPPAGCTQISNISDGGTCDAVHDQVKWGPFFVDLSRTVSYDVTPPSDATGEQCFEGTVCFGAPCLPIEGDVCVHPESIMGDFDGDLDVDLADHEILVDCMAGPETSPNPTAPVTAQECLDAFDFDEDADVDLADLAEFETAFTGS